MPQSRRYPPLLLPFSPQHQNCRGCAELRCEADGAVRTYEQRRVAARETSLALATKKGTTPCRDLGYAPETSPAEQSSVRWRARRSTEPAAPLAQALYEMQTPRAPQMPPVTPTLLPLAPRSPWVESGRCSADTEVTPITPRSDPAHKCSSSQFTQARAGFGPVLSR